MDMDNVITPLTDGQTRYRCLFCKRKQIKEVN